MAKKTKSITNNPFTSGLIIVLIIIFILISISEIHKRFAVRESDDFVKNPIITPGTTLAYNTEFCANKLSDLAHEIHFLEKDIKQQEKIEEDLMMLPELEGEVIKIEQREISVIRDEFNTYKKLCDQLDKTPTNELCSRFLQEAKQDLTLAQQNAKALANESFFEKLGPHAHNLRKTQRVYSGLQEQCKGVI